MKKIYILNLMALLSFGCIGNLSAAIEAQDRANLPFTQENETKTERSTISTGLANNERLKMTSLLNTLLANEYVLYTKTLKFHWNVRGKHFGALHTLFEKQYKQLLDIVDRVAERIRALGELSTGTLRQFMSEANVPEEPNSNPKDLGMIHQLLVDHESVIRLMREYSSFATDIQDDGTVNMLGDLLEQQEKMAWMLRAHLEQ